MSARDDILGRVRAALDDRPAEPQIAWSYGQPVATGDLDPVARFVERVEDYRAIVDRVDRAEAGAAVAEALARHGATTVVTDPAFLETWPTEADVTWVRDDDLSAADLDAVSAVATTCAVAIANTGTIVLDHGAGQGRRALSLVPDVHVCVVTADQIVTDVPEAVARLVAAGASTRPQTWISGPSATSDIELDRVEGVHGPRTLHVIVTQ